MPPPENSNRIAWLDQIRLIAVCAVVAVHVNAYGVINEFKTDGSSINWWICNVYGSILRCCVPFFVMITGTLLLPQQMPTSVFIKKRLNRILLPALFWGAVYVVYNLARNPVKYELFTHYDKLITWLITQVLYGPVYSFWYIYMLIGLYLFIPILQPWIKLSRAKGLLYFLMLWLALLILNQFQVIPSASPIDLRYFGGYIGYLILGYYLNRYGIITPFTKIIAWLLFFGGAVITAIGTYYSSLAAGKFDNHWYDYLTFNVFLLSSGGFLLFKFYHQPSQWTVTHWLQNFINRYGFSIYLIHPLPLFFLVHFGIGYQLFTPALGVMITTAICLIITGLISWLISKMPLGRYITG